MPWSMTRPKRSRRERGAIAYAVVASLSLTVLAVTVSYVDTTHRAMMGAQVADGSERARYAALGQLEIAQGLVFVSGYSAGRNDVLAAASAHPDRQIIDRDGWPTGVAVTELGAEGSGLFELVATHAIGDVTIRVRAAVSERTTTALYNTFVGDNPLAVAGGADATFPWADAPGGSIHTNGGITLLLPDRHFADPVTSVDGFSYASGALGPDDESGSNVYFHDVADAAAAPIAGVFDVNLASFVDRADSLFALEDSDQYAKIYLLGDSVRVEVWDLLPREREMTARVRAHYADTDIADVAGLPVDLIADLLPSRFGGRPARRRRELVQGTYALLRLQVQRVIDEANAAGLTTDERDSRLTELLAHVTNIGDEPLLEDPLVSRDSPVRRVGGDLRTEPIGRLESAVRRLADRVVFDRTVSLGTEGTVYVSGDVYLGEVERREHRLDTHLLDGKLTIASGDDILLRDSIQYASLDERDDWQTAYLNGDSETQPYAVNPAYTGTSSLALMAEGRVEYQAEMPQRSEINASLYARTEQVALQGLFIDAAGAVSRGPVGFLRRSLQRVGSVLSRRRPVSAFISADERVALGFSTGRSIADPGQVLSPPPGFPTIARARVIARRLD
jgi:hypothetical protein